ncbi:conjugal transfer protein [Vibrio parahaemolyticus]|nr:conjugal transfer protein [Vibrio parahaemolyticus]
MKRLILIAITFALSSTASAGVWEERALLERYLEQSKALQAGLVEKAEESQDPNARIRFDYDSLNADLEMVHRKIQHYLDNPMRQVVWAGDEK